MPGIVTMLVYRSELDAMDGWALGDCEDLLARFADAGVDIDSLAAQLQEEGAKAFVKSWSELMSVIDSTGVLLEKAAS